MDGSRALETEAYRGLYLHCMDAVLFCAPDGRLLAANPAATRLFGTSEEAICRLGAAGIVDGSDPRWEVLLEERDRTGRCRGETRMVRADGTAFTAEVSSALFETDAGEPRASLVVRDTTGTNEERLRAEAEIQSLTLVDELTGLHNSRGFVLMAAHELDLADQAGVVLNLLFLELPELEGLDVRLGAGAADAALEALARSLRQEARPADMLARIGPNRFVGLLHGGDASVAEGMALSVAERFERETERTLSRRVPLRIGRATRTPGSQRALDGLIRDARAAATAPEGESAPGQPPVLPLIVQR